MPPPTEHVPAVATPGRDGPLGDPGVGADAAHAAVLAELEHSRAEIARLRSLMARERRVADRTGAAPPGGPDATEAGRDAADAGPPDGAVADPAGLARRSVAGAGCGIVWLDPQFRFRQVNDAFCRMAGRTRGDLVGRPVADLNPHFEADGGTRPGVARFDVLRRERTDHFLSHLRRPDGDALPVGVHMSHLAFGDAEYAFAVVVDVTEQLRTRVSLRRSEERYRRVVEDQTEMIVRHAPDGTILFANPAYSRLVDHGEPLEGRSIYTFIAEGSRDGVRAALSSLTPGSPVGVQENAVPDGRGGEAWTEWINRALFDPDGTLREYQSVGRDVTDRKRAERALEAGRAQYRSVVDDLAEMVCRFRPDDGVVTFANRAFCEYHGLPPGEVVGRMSVFEGLAVQVRDRVLEAFAALTPESPAAEFLLPVRTPRGREAWHEWTDRALFDETGVVAEFQAVGRDVTARVHGEQQARATAAAAARVRSLSPREREVLVKVAAGDTNKAIAASLGITERTVEKHRSSTMRKLDVRSSADLVRIAVAAEGAGR